MARQNSMLPKGAYPYPRSPLAETAPHDPAHGGYPQSYEPPTHHAPEHGDAGAPRDIFNALRPEQGLTSRLEAFGAQPGGRFDPPRQDAYGHAPRAHDGYGRGGFTDASGQPYPAPGAYSQSGHDHDPYGRPLPGATPYPAHGYPGDGAAGHDPRHYGGHHTEPALDPGGRYPQAQPYPGQHDRYGHADAYPYDDPYRTEAINPGYGAHQDMPGAVPGQEGEYYQEDYAEEEPETRRGPRAIVVVGALLAAIGLGGGLAYGYKSLTNGGPSGGKLPILRADGAPPKAAPSDPGGKQVAHTDKKFLNRLTEEREAARPVPVSILPPPAGEREAGDGSTRRVPTMVVNRDGSIAPTGSAPAAAPPPPVTSVPGMLIEGLTPRTPPLREAQRPAPPPQAAAVEEPRLAPPPQQRRVAAAPPVVATDPPASIASPPAPAAEAKRRPPAVREAARTTSDAAPAPASTSGYVAVLASRKSHMDALKSFADMQQKYSSVLQGRTPDVREANLGEKGVWFRVVVGPPGSRETANNVCGQLKTQGYTGCWIMAY